jgi:Fe-S oxidoreductase
MPDKLVTVARFTDYIEAEMAKQMLDDHGIESVVTGQNVAAVCAGIPAAVNVELQTLESRARQAIEILESSRKQEQ